ncbi:hypothetical protein LguiB_005740 [Lonicera macranthoides]
MSKPKNREALCQASCGNLGFFMVKGFELEYSPSNPNYFKFRIRAVWGHVPPPLLQGFNPSRCVGASELCGACLPDDIPKVGWMDVKMGKEFHDAVNKLGFELDVSLANLLISMCNCGKIWYARKMFDEMPEIDVASLTSIICGYFSVGKIEESWH